MVFRIIARLDIKSPHLVKGIHLEGLRVLGDPGIFAQHYFNEGVDELHYQDIVASLYGRSSILDLVRSTAERVFIPLMVGGGIRNLGDIQSVLRAGADKVCINTAAVENPSFITESAKAFGSQCITVAIETLMDSKGRRRVFTNNGRQPTGLDAFDWVRRVVDYGAGEIILTSVDNEGTKRGLDLEFVSTVARSFPVPVIAHGGVGCIEHIADAARSGASAAAIASAFHYKMITVKKVKNGLKERDIHVRIENG